MGYEGSGRPPPPRDGRLQIRDLVESCCRPHGLPPDVVDDLVAEAAARWSPGMDLGQLVAGVDDLVRAEADRLGRGCRALLAPGGGVPDLLPAFLAVASFHPRPSHFRRALGSATVTVAKTALDAERFFLFFLAWLDGDDLESMRRVLCRREAAEGLKRRLRRVADTVQRELLRRMASNLPYAERTWLYAVVSAFDGRRKSSRTLPPPRADSWPALSVSLGRVVRGEVPKIAADASPGLDAAVGS